MAYITTSSLELSSAASSSFSNPSTPILAASEAPKKIPRPANCFIIFRSMFIQANREAFRRNQVELSKRAGEVWGAMSAQDRCYYRLLAKEKEREHKERYPDYRYKPEKRTGSGTKKSKSLKKIARVSETVLDQNSSGSSSPASIQQMSIPQSDPGIHIVDNVFDTFILPEYIAQQFDGPLFPSVDHPIFVQDYPSGWHNWTFPDSYFMNDGMVFGSTYAPGS